MPWARFDERFPTHRKVRRLSDAAFRLHVSAICWGCEYLTNGHISPADIKDITELRKVEHVATELVESGRWHLPGHNCPSLHCWDISDGWLIHNFLEFNPSKQEVEQKRRADAERKRKGRTSESRRSPGGVQAESERTHLGVQVESARTDPTRPDPNPSSTRKRATDPPDFMPLTDEMKLWAADNRPDLDPSLELEKMLDWARAKGEKKVNWLATWKNWMRNAKSAELPEYSGQRIRRSDMDKMFG